MSLNVLTKSHPEAPIVVNGRYRVHQITGVQLYAREIVSRLGERVEVCTPENAKGATGHLWEQTVLRYRSAGRLLWNPCGSGPLTYGRQVTTFHDLFPVEHPEWYGAAYARWYGVAMRQLAAQALHVIAVSEYTKSRLVKLLGRDPETITVVHNGLRTGCERASERKIHEAREALGVPSERYVLSLSSQESRKNLRGVLEAWSRIHMQVSEDTWLVLAGAHADESVYGPQGTFLNLPRVLFTGYVPEEHLCGLYSGASLFVFPSLAEGFGLPLLEAMACGVRCITSNTSSLPEVGGDVVDYVDPLDVQELADRMLLRLMQRDALRQPFEPAMKRAQEFSWDKAASATRAVLEGVAESAGSVSRSQRSVSTRGRHKEAQHQSGAEPRVALVHDWLTGMRGGEKVLESICRRFPTAPLSTLLYVPGSVSSTIAEREIHVSPLQWMPRAATKYRSYLPLFPLFAEMNKAAEADLVISTSHAVAKSMVRRFGRTRPYHICYIHTPMRYAWDMFDAYFGPDRVGWTASKLFFRPLTWMLQIYDRATAGRVDLYVANSTYVAERVQRIYGRSSEVLPPPVDTDRYLLASREPQEWYLVVSALVPYKRVDHAIRACSTLGRRLRIVGKGPELESLKELAISLKVEVEFVGFASDELLVDFYRQAKALLFPGIEDFGIVPLEAIACGCPVIALGVGGVLDSMTEETAVFYTEESVAGLIMAMRNFEERQHLFVDERLRQRAAQFSEAIFLDKLEQILLRTRFSPRAVPEIAAAATLTVSVTE
ncbi:glycosyltransferase [Granulicella arctica]|uniref:Glycosyltransferase involved in cell wall biosynthesis n=1 Tax=Granulicella arctica TaxID=940613 RepID=A0A7Y9PHD4_9BACT|nr:glycosyltransferase [Granulicella arctica]NYF79925.1 glycosyltransferase involved in cell wall biosynthesis [Granulicella arctica]